MPSSDLLVIVSTVAATIQTLVIAATLGILIWQTNLTRRSMQDLERQTRVDVATNRNLHLVQINEILLQDDSLAKDFGFEYKKEIVALLYLDNFEMRWYAHKEAATDKTGWEAEKQFIARTVRREAIQEVWKKEYKKEFHPEFARFLDQVILEVTPKSSPEQQRDGA